MAEGFLSFAARNEVFFLVFDGAAVFLASVILVAFFPGRVFGRQWREIAAPSPSSFQTPPSTTFATRRSYYDPSLPKSAGRSGRPSRHQPVQLHPAIASAAKFSAGPNPITNVSYPPRQPHTPAPPQRNMVDSEAIW